MHAENGNLGRVQDGRAHHRSKDAAIADCEGATGELVDSNVPSSGLKGRG